MHLSQLVDVDERANKILRERVEGLEAVKSIPSTEPTNLQDEVRVQSRFLFNMGQTLQEF